MKKVFAVLAGINDYADGRNRLFGCVNDVRAVDAYLQRLSDYAYDPEILTNAGATKQKIVVAIQTHLAKANAGDIALFYFSGHGTQEAAPGWAQEQDGKLECLVCYDDDPDNFLLADKELRYLFGKLPKDVHLISIFDCCHSGDNTRSHYRERNAENSITGTTIPSIRKARRYSDTRSSREWKNFLFHTATTQEELEQKGLDTVLPIYPHYHISSCRSHESAFEKDGYGIFTKYLISTLEQHKNQIRYKDIRQFANLYFFDGKNAQTPEVVAHGDANSLFDGWMGQQIPTEDRDYLKLVFQGNKWVMNAGQMHGITKDTRVNYKHSESSQVYVFQIGEVGQTVSSLNPNGTADLLKEDKQYSVWTDVNLPNHICYGLVDMDDNEQLSNKIRENLDTVFWIEQLDRADYHIVIFNDMVYFTYPFDHYRPLALQKQVLLNNALNWNELQAEMKVVEKRHQLAKLENPYRVLFHKMSLQIEVATSGSEVYEDITYKDFRLSRANVNEKRYLNFRITNTSNRSVHIAALKIMPNMEIVDNTLLDESVVKLGPDEAIEKKNVEFQLPEYMEWYNWNAVEVVFKFIISTREINTSNFTQKPLDPPFHNPRFKYLGDCKTRAFGIPKGIEREDWSTHAVSILLNNEKYNDLPLFKKHVDHPIVGPFIKRNFLS